MDERRGAGDDDAGGASTGRDRGVEHGRVEPLAEPDDGRAQQGAARTSRRQGPEIDALVVELLAALGAAQPPERTVQPERIDATGPLMEAVDILGHQAEVGVARLPAGQGLMAGVRLGARRLLSAPIVEAPDRLGVGGEGLRRRQRGRVVALPEPIGAPKGRQTALGGDPGAGQDDDGLVAGDEPAETLTDCHGHRAAC